MHTPDVVPHPTSFFPFCCPHSHPVLPTSLTHTPSLLHLPLPSLSPASSSPTLTPLTPTNHPIPSLLPLLPLLPLLHLTPPPPALPPPTQELKIEDLGHVNPEDAAEYQCDRLVALWDAEVAKSGMEKASLRRVWFQHIGYGAFFGLWILQVIQAGLAAMWPLLSKELIIYVGCVQEPSTCGDGYVQLTDWQLVLIVAGLVVSVTMSGFCQGYVLFFGKRLALRAYGALTTAIFRKSLR